MTCPITTGDLTTTVRSRTSVTAPPPASRPPTTTPTIMVERITPHPLPWLGPGALSSPAAPMLRTSSLMNTARGAGDLRVDPTPRASPTPRGGPTATVGLTTRVTFSTTVGSHLKVSLTTIKRPTATVRSMTRGAPSTVTLTTVAGTIIIKATTTEGLSIMERPIPITLSTRGPPTKACLATPASTTAATTATTESTTAESARTAPDTTTPSAASTMSSSPETLEPRRVPTQGVLDGLTESPDAGHPHASRVSNKVHPQDSCSKTSGSWAEEEQFQKRKTIRAQRAHRKLHNWLWENICHLFHGLRKMLRNLTDSLVFDAFIFLVVCLNTIMLVAQTFAEVEIRGEWYFIAFDSIFLSIYVVEAMLKIIAMGLDYFCDAWNNLDFIIMIMAVVDFTLMQFNSRSFKRTIYNQKVFRVFKVSKSLRALRAIRVLRRLSFLTSLQEVTGTLVRSLPSITAILVLMFTCLFLFSVVLRALFRQSDPKRFQNIFTTIFTLFTLLTLDDWSEIYLDSWDQGAWYIIPILMIYIIIQYFIFLNLVIAVLVDNFQMALLRGLEKVKQERAARIQEPLLCESLTELDKAEPKEVMSEHTKQKRLIEKKFGTMTEKQQELVFHFLQLVAGVEHYQQKFRSQASVIDEIVDTAFETGEEDFRK
ncbi:cation channel sperm-associated protein 1 [Pteronotus mesoamericanus]|uniref:cation channel sperm-associated protein 1 n=1 Tax=Pteronotus mesoamericanus TaxID=1884717 RepID=UPI0023EDCBA4|nr:cation channel sperm-associated protein 1 [Pteronotus parnellii mesoamericanus]